ncbi:pentapeptide repeat-containing protein [Amycolatopsis sp. NBC_01480]|uniref:pentapeptide repeat-containing protein n=1 Tax=Amycolatopsis sp. NBC_01480 TaxID=2903562 RepID=UPI002E2D79F6|nr:pentapeptide repeat-containing protein [Amycolatopsis sp. NBC_01480]
MVIVVPVAVIAAVAMTVLLTFVSSGDPKDRIELIKTGLTVGAGAGGVVALVLSGRRQWSTEHDATERRLTDLYVKAVEQLGSDRAMIRHGGIYALERVAQDNPSQRQTAIDVLCAYLRAPFSPPAFDGTRRLGRTRPAHTKRKAGGPTASVAQPSSATLVQQHEEMEVRLTAQRVLARHLRPGPDLERPADTYWPGINLDLTHATLVDFDLSKCSVGQALFWTATFHFETDFADATFAGVADFFRARFTGRARFDRAVFHNGAGFNLTEFSNEPSFKHTVGTLAGYGPPSEKNHRK